MLSNTNEEGSQPTEKNISPSSLSILQQVALSLSVSQEELDQMEVVRPPEESEHMQHINMSHTDHDDSEIFHTVHYNAADFSGSYTTLVQSKQECKDFRIPRTVKGKGYITRFKAPDS